MTWVIPEHFDFSCLERNMYLSRSLKKVWTHRLYIYDMHSEQAKTYKNVEITAREQQI